MVVTSNHPSTDLPPPGRGNVPSSSRLAASDDDSQTRHGATATTPTADARSDLLKLIRRGIADPGASTKRGVDNPQAHPDDQEPENLRSWAARAVLAELERAGMQVVPRPPDDATGKIVDAAAASPVRYRLTFLERRTAVRGAPTPPITPGGGEAA